MNIGELKRLQYLNLCKNSIADHVPNIFANLQNGIRVNANNLLTGTALERSSNINFANGENFAKDM